MRSACGDLGRTDIPTPDRTDAGSAGRPTGPADYRRGVDGSVAGFWSLLGAARDHASGLSVEPHSGLADGNHASHPFLWGDSGAAGSRTNRGVAGRAVRGGLRPV